MVLRGLLAAGLAVFSPPALGLQTASNTWNPPLVATQASSMRGCRSNGAYKQKLSNMMNLQYYGQIELGDQTINGIIDTGSFELVVFSKSCTTCGQAAAYNEKQSSTFVRGNASTVHSYGSGSCMSEDGWEDINMACFGARPQSLWLAKQCQMPALMIAKFNAIVGVGPPGQPEFVAKLQLERVKEAMDDLESKGQPVPEKMREAKRRFESDLEMALQKPALLQTFNMTTFSQCLGKKEGSPGYMIWNDEKREGAPGVRKIPVAGNITWGIQIQEVSFAMPNGDMTPFGCKGGCGAVVDTGTSLMAVPSSTYKGAMSFLQSHFTDSDCNDLSQFPDLIIKAGGHSFRLPPSSYLGTMEGMFSGAVTRYMHAEPAPTDAAAKTAKSSADVAARAASAASEAAQQAATAARAARDAARKALQAANEAATLAGEPNATISNIPEPRVPSAAQPKRTSQGQGVTCQLLMMDLGEKRTPLGSMFILGMPWFRQFYTTFDLGAGRGDRSILVSRATEDCDPESQTAVVEAHRSHDDVAARHLDASLIREPRWLDSLPEGEF